MYTDDGSHLFTVTQAENFTDKSQGLYVTFPDGRKTTLSYGSENFWYMNGAKISVPSGQVYLMLKVEGTLKNSFGDTVSSMSYIAYGKPVQLLSFSYYGKVYPS